MSDYNVKNYTEQGGEKTVIGGTLQVESGATVSGLLKEIPTASATTLGGVKVGNGLAVTSGGALYVDAANALKISDGILVNKKLSHINAPAEEIGDVAEVLYLLLEGLEAKGYMESASSNPSVS